MRPIAYDAGRKGEWDAFVEASKNGTFILKRDFMEYHADRFEDCSLMIYEKEKLVALFPANWEKTTRTVWSHQGLTYGGLILSENNTVEQTIRIMKAVIAHYHTALGAEHIVYKAIPHIYSTLPSEEDLYALSREGARLKWRMVSSAVDLSHPLRMRTLRQRGVRKALDGGCYVERVGEGDGEKLRQYWTLLEEVLMKHHNATPVHSYEEISRLMTLFPKEIRLYSVMKDGEMVAGTLMFETPRTAHVQYIASGDKGRECGALDMLFKYLITEHYKGLAYVDLGTSVRDNGRVLNEGLIFQKEGFGGRAVCYDTYEIDLERVHEGVSYKVPYLSLARLNGRSEPQLSEVVNRVVKGGWYLLGEWNKRFSQEWSKRCSRKYCTNVGNGLDALTLTLTAYKKLRGWDEECEVIVPANTYIATILAIVRAGLKPVLCEPDRETALMTAEGAFSLVRGGRTVALLPVHLYGGKCDMRGLRTVADKKHLVLIDDCAQAHGIFDGENEAMADANCWSFYPGKNMGALGDAGAVTTDDEELARIIAEMANYGQKEKYVNTHIGCNSRMDEIQAAALCVKMNILEADNERRREIAEQYRTQINKPHVRMLKTKESVWHVFPVMCAERDALREWLKEKGIETMIHYPIAPHEQEALKGIVEGRYPITEQMAREELSLPIAPYMTDADVDAVVQAVNSFGS